MLQRTESTRIIRVRAYPAHPGDEAVTYKSHTIGALFFTIIIGAATATVLPDLWGFSGTVERVIDGDTFIMSGGQRIRLWGIDAPELSQPYGPQARQALIAITKGKISCKQYNTSYNRWVAQCWAANQDIGGVIVTAGYAMDYPKYSGGHYRQEQADAAAAKRGMWAGDPIAPADWRSQHKKGY